jgi:hypothetical protein
MKKNTLLIASALSLSLLINEIKAQDTIPLIIHIVHNAKPMGTGANIAQAQVMSQFPILNADFAGQGWNVGNVPAVWAPLVGNANIVFVPALVDTSGTLLAEPGIERIDEGSRGWSIPSDVTQARQEIENVVKPQSIWDPTRYCNVWIADISISYATMPNTVPPTKDGLVFSYQMWGDILAAAGPFRHGRSATHEFGHWLGLTHLQNNCGPQPIADIPVGQYNYMQWLMASPVFPDAANACSGYPDGPMFMNFMIPAWSNDSDIYMFTNGQVAAMQQSLADNHASVTTSGVWHTTSLQQTGYEESAFFVFPNPTTGNVQIRLNVTGKNGHIKVFNTLGAIIYEKAVTDWTGTYSLSLSGEKSGMYFVAVMADGKTTTQKIILEE